MKSDGYLGAQPFTSEAQTEFCMYEDEIEDFDSKNIPYTTFTPTHVQCNKLDKIK